MTKATPTVTPPTRAAFIRTAVQSLEDALGQFDAALALPGEPAERLKCANAQLLALAGLDTYPGPGVPDLDERAAGTLARLQRRAQELAETLARHPEFLRRTRTQLSGEHNDTAFPMLAPGDFAGGLRLATYPDTGFAHVGRWSDLRRDHPARRFVTEADAAVLPEHGPALVLATGPRPPAGGVDLSEIVRLTRSVANRWASHRAEREYRQRIEAEQEAERRARDPMYQIEALRGEVERMKAERAVPVG